jgi:hypothetical protein
VDERLPEQLDIGCRDGQHEASLHGESKRRANRSVGLLLRDAGVVMSHCVVTGGDLFAVGPVIIKGRPRAKAMPANRAANMETGPNQWILPFLAMTVRVSFQWWWL